MADRGDQHSAAVAARADTVSESVVGRTVARRYAIREEIGVGGMARVFLATDTRLKRDVAVKMIRSELADDAESCAAFMREAELMAMLRHPNVLEIYDLGVFEGVPYLVMPYLRGQNLYEWCRANGGMPVETGAFISIIEQVCLGVGAMHALGLIHRDIKPTNILVSDDLDVTLVDLGLTLSVEETRELGILAGTPGFLAPELVMSHPLDPELVTRSDIYSLGVTAYWLLCGEGPTVNDFEALEKSYPWSVLPPSELLPCLPTTFDAPVLAALAMNPAQRPTAPEFRRSLVDARERSGPVVVDARRPFVLVVDDDPIALDFLEEILREAAPDAQLMVLRDPRAALAVIETQQLDLIITDVDMPHINGLELTASVRGNPATRATPIMIYSGVADEAEWRVLASMEATVLLRKPASPDELFGLVQRLLRPRELARQHS